MARRQLTTPDTLPDNPPERSTFLRVLAVLLIVAGLFGSLAFGTRSYRTFLILQSAHEVGVPAASAVRPWMTVGYVSEAYRIPPPKLVAGLGLPAETSPDTALRDVADDRGISYIDIVKMVQSAIADSGVAVPDDPGVEADDDGGLTDAFLTALLTFGYPALALVLLLGAIGAPVPTGVTTVLAGSLAAGEAMTWPLAFAIASGASVTGDVVGYSVGRLAGERFVVRHGHLLGYAGSRKQRVEWLFRRWGGVTVLLTRTLVSHLSSLASLLAGLSRYSLALFLVYAAVGRLLWTAAYLGLGYFVGNELAAASGFLGSLTGLFISLAAAIAAAAYLAGLKPKAVATL
ncbi:MAG: DedA family protein [Alphaproteobacteria bacterium]